MQCSERAILMKTETYVSALIVLETTRGQSLTVWCTRNEFAWYNKVPDNCYNNLDNMDKWRCCLAKHV